MEYQNILGFGSAYLEETDLLGNSNKEHPGVSSADTTYKL
jgi:hypothetical protein